MAYYVSSGQVSSGIILTNYDSMYVYYSGTAVDTTVNYYGKMVVSSGGTANSTTLRDGGYLVVSSGGTANSTTVNYYGEMDVSSGGTANSTTVNSYGYLVVSSGGTANSTTVNSGGRLYVSSGGTAMNIVWTPCVGSVYVKYGGYATYVSSYSGVYYGSADQLLSSAVVMDGKTVTGTMYVFRGGTAKFTTVNSGGSLYASRGGKLTGTLEIVSGGSVYVEAGVELNGDLTARKPSDGLLCNDIFSIYFYGRPSYTITVSADQAEGTYALIGGLEGHSPKDLIYDPVTISTTDHDSASFKLGKTVTLSGQYYTLNLDDGLMTLIVSDEPVVSGLVLTDLAYNVSSGYTSLDTQVNSGGVLNVLPGGTANFTKVDHYGILYVSSGGKVTGTLEISSGGSVYFEQDGEMNFDLTARKPSDAVLINDVTRMIGGSLPSFTITVSASQAGGNYKLAGGVTEYILEYLVGVSATITTTAHDSASISVGETVTLSGRDYTLNLDNDLLTLAVSGGPEPTAGDLNMDGRADIVMTIDQSTHPADGATGAWLIQENQIPVWGDLSTRNAGWEIFGTGKTAAGKNTDDVYIKSESNIVGAWTTGDDGLVNGWETIGEFNADAQVLGLGDFNGNGQSDLLLRAANGAVGCYFTNGQGWNYFQSLGDEWKLCAIGDLNGDGRDDVVLKHDAGFAGSWLTQADGTPMWADLDTLPDGFEIVGAGDFNGDGTDDVLLKNGGYYGAWLVQNGNAVGWMGLGDFGNATVEQIADFNGDGVDDLRIRTAAGDLGAQLVMGADSLDWHYYGSVGAEWNTSLAALS